MNPTSLEEIYRSKQDRRSELAALPAEDKLRIMEKLQEMGRSMQAARGRTKNVIAGQRFENQVVVLDFQYFENCTFKDCTIVIHGTGPVSLEGCNFERCEFGFEGPAGNTLGILSMMYHNGFSSLVDQLLESVRRAQPPTIRWGAGNLEE